MKPYLVGVYDCCGLYTETACTDFPEALRQRAAYRERFKGQNKVVEIANTERCDYNSDGLTEEEKEEL